MNDRTPNPAETDTIVDAVNVDAVAAAVRVCPGVEQLHGGPPRHTATYLPGRRVEGVGIEHRALVVQVRARWGVPAPELAAEIRGAITSMAGGRRIDIIVAEVGDPPTVPSPHAELGDDAVLGGRDEPRWTTTNAFGAPSAASSSEGTIPTAAATPPPSPPV